MIQIKDSVLECQVSKYLKDLKGNRLGLYESISEKDKNRISSPESTSSYYAMANFFGTYDVVKWAITAETKLDGKNSDRNTATNLLSLYAASIRGSKLTSSGNKTFKVTIPKIDFAQTETCLREDIIKNFCNGLKYVHDSKDLPAYTHGFLDTLANQILKEKDSKDYSPITSQLDRYEISVNGVLLKGFECSDTKKEINYNFDVSLDDVVGNKLMIQATKRGLQHILLYEPERKQNPLVDKIGPFQKTFFITGRPGTGKTTAIKACLNYAKNLSENRDIEFKILNITNEFKSKYYSESSRKLKEIFDEVNQGDKAYVIVCDDIDLVFPNIKSHKVEFEDSTSTEVLMHHLEGIMSNNFFNSIFVATTNNIDGVYEPLLERLREFEVEAKGPENQKDYTDLIKIKLKKPIESGIIEDVDFNDLGKSCFNHNLSGRGIKNISVRIIDQIENNVDYEDALGLDTKTKKQKIDLILANKTISRDKVEDIIENYALEEKENESKILERDIESCLYDIKTKAEALRRFEDGSSTKTKA